MDAYNHRSHRDAGRVGSALDRLAHLAALDPAVVEHVRGLASYHESEAASAYPLFRLADIAELVPQVVADNPQLAEVLEYLATADSDVVAVVMAAIKERIDELTGVLNDA